MQVFTSLEDLNKFFETKGLPPISMEMLGIEETDTDEQQSIEINQDDEETVEALQLKLINKLAQERDQVCALYEQELKSHTECHEHIDAAMHQMRVTGYAEGIASGLFPGKPFETLTRDQQESIYRQAEMSIQRIDEIRAANAVG